uniref:sugar ABC transporter ATP-binding protein n=1 Tax=Anaerococcus mediterraneensis TaxID=1870984 RepID=UPI0009319AFF|nr:sugar ABC transporter ATP-binding protein [Anaerococcus mediterraneensis]
MAMPFLELENVSKTFPGVKALKNVKFDIYPGEVHSLVGENGAGKSTLIKVITGAHKPDEGSIIKIEGQEVEFNGVLDSLNKGISVIYQDFSLFGNLTVAENIMINQIIERGDKVLNWKDIKEKSRIALDKVGVKINPMEIVDNLSVARKQIVAIASAIAQDAKMIIMDEPTSALSTTEADNLFNIIDHLRDEGMAVMFVSHKMDELFRVSDRFTVFRDGQYVDTMKIDETDRSKLISKMVGRELMIEDYSNPTEKDDVILEVENLSKKGNYKDISFKLNKGEILGITGLVGSGRSEVLQTIFGIVKADSGKIKIKGKEVSINSPKAALENSLGLVPESRQTQGLVLDYPISDNIVLPVLSKYKKNGVIDDSKKNEDIESLMELLDVRPNNPDALCKELSGGNQQKVVLAKWIGTKVQILMIDEPTNGVDVGAKTEIHKILRKLANEGTSIIVVSSDLPEVLSVSDRILVMRRGRISGEFMNKDLNQEMIMDKAVVK